MGEWFYIAPPEEEVAKHYGLGKHPSGSPQGVHAGGKWGKGGRRRRTRRKKWQKVGIPKGKVPSLSSVRAAIKRASKKADALAAAHRGVPSAEYDPIVASLKHLADFVDLRSREKDPQVRRTIDINIGVLLRNPEVKRALMGKRG